MALNLPRTGKYMQLTVSDISLFLTATYRPFRFQYLKDQSIN